METQASEPTTCVGGQRRERRGPLSGLAVALGLIACSPLDDRVLAVTQDAHRISGNEDVFPDGSTDARAIGGDSGQAGSGPADSSSSTGGSTGGAGGSEGTGGGGTDANTLGTGACVHLGLDGKPDCSDTLVTNADFNRNIAGWPAADATATVAWNSTDSQGAKTSGSISVTSTNVADLSGWDGAAAAAQCVRATPGTTYKFAAEIFIPTSPNYGDGEIAVWFYRGTTCAGLPDNGQAYLLQTVDVTNTWTTAEGNLVTPDADESMAVRLAAGRPFRDPPFHVLFDAVRVQAQP